MILEEWVLNEILFETTHCLILKSFTFCLFKTIRLSTNIHGPQNKDTNKVKILRFHSIPIYNYHLNFDNMFLLLVYRK